MTVPNEHDRLLNGLRDWLLLFAIWTIPALVASSTVHLSRLYANPHEPWLLIFSRQLPIWYYWALLCPLLYMLLVRFPLNRDRWHTSLLVMMPVSVAVAVSVSFLFGMIRVYNYDLAFREGWVGDVLSNYAMGRHQSNFLICWLTIGGLSFIRETRLRRKQEQAATELALQTSRLQVGLTEARLEQLRMQLQPHFLFNTLNSIASLVETGRNDEAYQTIIDLGALLRTTLDDTDKHVVSVEKELDLVRNYLKIEQIRFADRLHLDIEVDPNCLEASIPAMLLQPVVENSVRHGLSGSDTSGRIGISINQVNGSLQIRVTDDGIGLPESWSMDDSSGIGLNNIRQRLDALYGSAYSLSIENARPGVTVTIEIPYQIDGKANRESRERYDS